jgi:hypothetical protein
MKPFPTIWARGNEAGFYIDDKLIRVPLKFGSGDMSLHVIPWLYRLWPLRIKDGRLVKIMRVDGTETEIALHKWFAEAVHCSLEFDFDYIKAVDGDYLNWTALNLVPRRNPNKPTTETEKTHEVERQMWKRKGELEFIARTMRHAVTTALHAHDAILTTDQSIDINTCASRMMTEWERNLAEDFKVGDAERVNHEQHDEEPLHENAAELFAAPHPFYEGQEQSLPFRQIATDSKPARSSRITDMDDENSDEETATTAPTKHVILYETQPPVPTPYETVEQVLNHFGWFSPENGHRPIYEGHDSKAVWLRTRPVRRYAFEKTTRRVQADPKPYAPSKLLLVREVPIDLITPRPRLRPDTDTGCGCFNKMSFPRVGVMHLPSCKHAPAP